MKKPHLITSVIIVIVLIVGAVFYYQYYYGLKAADYTRADLNQNEIVLIGKDGQSKSYLHITGADSSHVNAIEYHAGQIYVVGQENNQQQLYRVDLHRRITQLYAAAIIDFRVSADNRWVAIYDYTDSPGHLVIYDLPGQKIKTVTDKEVSGNKDLVINTAVIGWTTLNKVWLKIDYPDHTSLALYDPVTDQSTSYRAPDNMPLGTKDWAMSAPENWLAYSTFPKFLDAESENRFGQQKTPVTLYVMDIITSQRQELATKSGQPFNPSWISSNELQYLKTSQQLSIDKITFDAN